MMMARTLFISGVVGTLIAFGCSSDKKGSSGGTGARGFINFDSGVGAMSPGQTEDGLQPITPDKATALKDAGSACQGWSAEPEGGPAVLEFQVDVTLSMNSQTTSTGNQSKWAVMQTALPEALAALPEQWAIGLAFFNGRVGECYQGRQAVPIALNTQQQKDALSQAIQGQRPADYTPTQAAWQFAYDQLQAYTGSNKYVVLVTDGVPTINNDPGCTIGSTGLAIGLDEYTRFIDTVRAATTASGTKTFVVGVPGSEQLQQADYDPMYELSLLAEAGQTGIAGCTPASGTPSGGGMNGTVNPRGTYCHYDMTQTTDFATGLKNTIQTIGNAVLNCNYNVPPAPTGQTIDPNKVVLIYEDGSGNAFLVLQETGATCDRGWTFTDADKTKINICDKTCSLLQSNPSAKLTLMFGCTQGDIVS